MTDLAVVEEKPKRGLITRFAERYGIEPGRVLDTLKATAFKSERPVSNEQMMALMIVAERYGLDPFTKELYAYPDKGGGIVPVVSVDGWSRMVNEQPMFDGLGFEFDREQGAMTCTIWRKDRAHPTEVEELIDECFRDTPAWKKSPRRMIRHRAFMQCARLAFGFAGLHDDDEAQRIVEVTNERPEPPSTGAQKVRAMLSPNPSNDLGTPAPPDAEDAVDVGHLEGAALYFARLARAPDADSAALVLDEARSVPTVTQGQYEELAQAWASKWQPNEE